MSWASRSPLAQLTLARLRELIREPEALIWVYGLPVLMLFALGLAFRQQGTTRVAVDVERGPASAQVYAVLAGNPRFRAQHHEAEAARRRLRLSRTDIVVSVLAAKPARYRYDFDPSRPDSSLARQIVDDALQRAAGRRDAMRTEDRLLQEPGSRYVDFLLPGLLGLAMFGAGLWGVGYVIVDMRLRRLLKRLVATPMRRGHLLLALVLSRMVFGLPQVLLLLLIGWLVFGVVLQGGPLIVAGLLLLGLLTFGGIGLLVASRTRTMEATSGLINLVMLPSWLLSGTFFSYERFPEVIHPLIKYLPLTLLNDTLRAVTLEGASLMSLGGKLLPLLGWGVLSYVLALSRFRWN